MFLGVASAVFEKVITPTVSGVVVIGLSLVHVGITDFGGGFGAKRTAFGSMENLGLASLVLLIVLIFNCMKNPLLRGRYRGRG